MNLPLITGLFIIACVTTGQAIRCYQCQNENDCKEKPTECDAEKERPYCVKLNGTDENGAAVYMKGCSGLPALSISFPAVSSSTNLQDKCKTTVETNGMSHTLCLCISNLCNNANVQSISFSFMFVVVSMQLMRNFM